MLKKEKKFDKNQVLDLLKKYLPHQAPLKDFIHHNTLQSFQNQPFHEALKKASQVFGYQTYLSFSDYLKLYQDNQIDKSVIQQVIIQRKGNDNLLEWQNKMLSSPQSFFWEQNIGLIRNCWKNNYHIHLDKVIHPILFRIIGAYLDQGISIWKFPNLEKGFLESVIDLQEHQFLGLFKSALVKDIIKNKSYQIENLLSKIVGDEQYFEYYLFDQQFSHPGWSGLVAVIEKHPHTLLDERSIHLSDFIVFELLLELDYLETHFKSQWKPLSSVINNLNSDVFKTEKDSEIFEILSLWQEAYEWTFYNQVLNGIQKVNNQNNTNKTPSFQALFCIDDRECSIRRHVEYQDNDCETFGTAGFFNVEFYFQPENGLFYTKSCPAPLNPKFLIQEIESKREHQQEIQLNKSYNSFFKGFLSTHLIGFWTSLKLIKNVFVPSENPIMNSAKLHMDFNSTLTIKANDIKINSLQVGYSIVEMADRMEVLLKSIGLNTFSPLVYLFGHGASSVNNTHFAGYDCGACSGRAGSVNARVAAQMLNNSEVRLELTKRLVVIPDSTQFIGALHDTTKDEFFYYDIEILSSNNRLLHLQNCVKFQKALELNAKERSRRFLLIDKNLNLKKTHEKVKKRAFSLFEPRPEWNHATNAICIVGNRQLSKNLFLDRRAFLNSYDYKTDVDGKYLSMIFAAIAPVCGGINLEYYFSRVDNHRLGAGSKLPHNVMGLNGVANGMDGDLRPGLPLQMINIHDPIRLLVVVEQEKDLVLEVLNKDKKTLEWFQNEWIHLSVVQPITKEIWVFKNNDFFLYSLPSFDLKTSDIQDVITSSSSNIPVQFINKPSK